MYCPNRKGKCAFMATLILAVFMLAGMQGCSYLRVINQDQETIAALQEIKADAEIVYSTFVLPKVDQGAIDLFATKIHELWDHQKAKGEANRETSARVEMVGKLFGKHAMDRINNGQWLRVDSAKYKELFLSVVDILVEAETFKPVMKKGR